MFSLGVLSCKVLKVCGVFTCTNILHGCILRIYFDNKGDNVTLTLYNVTLTPQKPCQHNNNFDPLYFQ